MYSMILIYSMCIHTLCSISDTLFIRKGYTHSALLKIPRTLSQAFTHLLTRLLHGYNYHFILRNIDNYSFFRVQHCRRRILYNVYIVQVIYSKLKCTHAKWISDAYLCWRCVPKYLNLCISVLCI